MYTCFLRVIFDMSCISVTLTVGLFCVRYFRFRKNIDFNRVAIHLRESSLAIQPRQTRSAISGNYVTSIKANFPDCKIKTELV